MKRINLEKIGETIVGLKTYEGVKKEEMEKKVITYIAWTESHNEPSISAWTFLVAAILMLMNLYGKGLKQAYQEEYGIRKIVESYFKMQMTDDEGVDVI